ncbi:MAG: hypothetical protein WAN34_07185 [Acidimicrobiia bacterium]
MNKWSLLGAWALAAVLATALAWQIVAEADARVSDRPVAPLRVSAPVAAAADTTTSTTTPATSLETTSTTLDSTSSTTSASTTTTTQPTTTSTTPTTTTGAAWSTKTIQTEGGVVSVSYRPQEVSLTSAVPAPGFAAQIKKKGPPSVEVKFSSNEEDYDVKVEWSDGQLKIESDGSEHEHG